MMVVDQDALARNFVEGAYSLCSPLSKIVQALKGLKKRIRTISSISLQDATSYFLNFNLDRKSYKFTSKTSDAEKKSTQEAVLNKKLPSSH